MSIYISKIFSFLRGTVHLFFKVLLLFLLLLQIQPQLMDRQKTCSNSGKRKIKTPQLASQEPQNRFSGTVQGKVSEVIPIPPQQEQIAEDVLCSIISRLRLRDAVRTSVLSRRWRHIWTRIPVFKFDGTTLYDARTRKTLFGKRSLLTRKEKYELSLQKTDHFISLVDSVLQQHQGDRVEEFTVYFFLHRSHSHRLDQWVHFAIAAKTKKLRLDLRQPFTDIFEEVPFYNSHVQLYEFPTYMLATSFVEELCLAYCSLDMSRGFEVFQNIKGLTLIGIDITEEGINQLLSNCSALENVSLQYNQQWKTLSIPCHLSQLRSLAVQNCYELRKIEINPINLKRICYQGLPSNIVFNRSSQLEYTEIRFITAYSTQNLDYYLTKLHRNLPNLRSLTFYIFGSSKVTDLRKGSYNFIQLRRLDLTWDIKMKMSVLHLATLLDVAPFLEVLKLRLRLSTRIVEKTPQSLTKLSKMLPKQPHAYLKTIEISGFCSDKWQVEIALYLLSNATKLDSMTIEKDQNCSLEIQETDIKNLSQNVPANVKFVIV